MNVKKMLNRALAWLVGSSCQLSVDGCQLSEPTTGNCQPTTAQAPFCPVCKGRPVRGKVENEDDEDDVVFQWFYWPCDCGGGTRRAVLCPVCCGAGRVTRELIVEHEALGEVALADYRRAAVGN